MDCVQAEISTILNVEGSLGDIIRGPEIAELEGHAKGLWKQLSRPFDSVSLCKILQDVCSSSPPNLISLTRFVFDLLSVWRSSWQQGPAAANYLQK